MVFYYFGPDEKSWAFGNDHFSLANNLTGSIAAVWNQLGANLTDKQQAGTLIRWMSTAGDNYAIMTKKGDLMSNCSDMLNNVKQQLRDIPGTSVYHVSLSPQGGWFVCYEGGTCQIGGRWPISFHTLAGDRIDPLSRARQASTIKSIFIGHSRGIVINTSTSVIWENVSPQLDTLLGSFSQFPLTMTWPLPGPNTVLCPWSPNYCFVEAVPSLLGETQYPHYLPDHDLVNPLVFNFLRGNMKLPGLLKPKLSLVASLGPALTTPTPTQDASNNTSAVGNLQSGTAKLFALLQQYASPPAPNALTPAPQPYTSPLASLFRSYASPSTTPSPLPPSQQSYSAPEEPPSEMDKLGKKFMDSSLKDSLTSAIVSKKPNVKWEDVAGLETAKSELQEAVIFPIRFPQMFHGKRQARRALLLYGPPGTGKSYLAKAVATEVDHTLFSVSSGDVMSKWTGESEGLMRQLFVLAREKKPSIIFIDEIDALCGKRDSGSANAEDTVRLKTEFLVQMDGFGNDNEGVFVLAATNLPWTLDPAVRRRFQKRVHVPLPDNEARQELFKVHLGDMASSLNNTELEFTTLAKRTEGFSGSDIANFVQDALMIPIRKVHAATHFRKFRDHSGEWYTPCRASDVGATAMRWSKVPAKQLKEPPLMIGDLYEAVENTKALVGQEEIDKCAEWTKQFGMEGA